VWFSLVSVGASSALRRKISKISVVASGKGRKEEKEKRKREA
jgi:hypothetical protein